MYNINFFIKKERFMEKRLLMFLAGMFLSIGMALAQTQVKGTVVSSSDGEPVVGASVVIPGTKTGTVTDIDGNFSLSVPSGSKLVISYLGMQSKTVNAASRMKVQLDPDDKVLDEVVVTAMGIKRSEKTLGYAATTVSSDELKTGHNTDVTNSLAGKVAGLQIQSTSSDPGQSTSVVIRGFGSINGNNQPLYVVDGVPLSNTVFNGETGLSSRQGYSNALGGISNINSNDVESMTILKGAAATALYGSRAANGAVIITTKSGKKGDSRNFTITYDGNIQARQIANLPQMQNEFGQGWDGTQTYIENGSWGAAFDGTPQLYGPIWNNQSLIHNYSAAKNNVKDFFDTGISQSHSLAISGVSSDNNMTYYLSYSHSGDNGIMPGKYDTYSRNTVSTRGSFKATDWMKFTSSVNFAKTNTNTVGSYQGVSVIDGLYEMPRDISIVDHKDLSVGFNTPEAYFTPYGITNPYWALANNYNHNDSKQINGKIQVDINPIKELTLTYRFGFDYTDFDLKVGTPQIALTDALINDNRGYAPAKMNQTGSVFARYQRSYELNNDFLANYQKKFLEDRLDINANAGVNINERYFTRMTGQTDDLTFYTGFWQLPNGATKTTISEYPEKRRLVGAFGDVTVGWEDMLFLELQARNDWSSTLPINANSYFYPGATLSWIFTNLIPENNILSFGKARMAYGQTGNDASPYLTSVSFSQAASVGYYQNPIIKFPVNGVNAFQESGTIGSTSLKPEKTTEFEVGLNLQFLKGRIGLDFAYYNRETKDQIFELPVDPATGYSFMVTNFGSVRNRGIELLLTTTPVKTSKIRWDVDFNFAMNRNKVLSLPKSLEGGKTVINQFSAGNEAVYMYAEEGKPMGSFYTYLPTRTADGKIIVGTDGLPVLNKAVEDTGKNMNYDWTGGVTTSLSAYGFTLSASLDVRKGGYMFSRTKKLMQFTGNGTITTYNERRPFVIPNSVVSNGDGTYSENTTPIFITNDSYQKYFNDYGYGQGGEAYLISKSFVKLRNITLSYSLPKKLVKAMYLTDFSVSAFCNNVFTWTAKDNYYIDPEVSSYGNDLEGQFGELYSNPSCRVFGGSVSVKF